MLVCEKKFFGRNIVINGIFHYNNKRASLDGNL